MMSGAEEAIDSNPAVPRARYLAVLVGMCAPYVLLAHRFWFISDDAFITFRYARNWVNGHGLRYNLGDHAPAEGFSNFLWVVISAVFELVGLDPTTWVPVLSFCCGLILLVFVHWVMLHRLKLDASVAFLSTLTLSCFPPFAVWATGGLETMVFALALFFAFDRMALRPEVAPVTGALASVAVSLLRTEGIAWAVVIAVVAYVSRPFSTRTCKVRSLAVYVTIVAAGYAVFFYGRYSYFGLPFPLPVYTKVGFGSDVLLRGFRYVAVFFLTFLTPFLIFPSLVAALRKPWRGAAISIALMAVAVPAYSIVVGGDWMTMGRFLVPGFAFQTLALGLLLQWAWSYRPKRRALVVAATVASIVVALLPAWDVHLVPRSVRMRYRFMYSFPGFDSEYVRWTQQDVDIEYYKKIGFLWKKLSKPGDSLVIGAVGAVGYYSDLYIYDRFGLVTPRVALRRREKEPLRAPGHDYKVSRDFFLEDNPTFLLDDIPAGARLRDRIVGQARAWQGLWANTLWRRYVPDFVVFDEKPVSEAEKLLFVLRAIEEPDDTIERLPRPERRRARAKRATKLWDAFYQKAQRLPNEDVP